LSQLFPGYWVPQERCNDDERPKPEPLKVPRSCSVRLWPLDSLKHDLSMTMPQHAVDLGQNLPFVAPLLSRSGHF